MFLFLLQQENQQNPQANTMLPQSSYADIIVKPNGSKPNSPGYQTSTGYSDVYVFDSSLQQQQQQQHQQQDGQGLMLSDARQIPRNSQQKSDFCENYENMNFSDENTTR